MTGLPWRRRGSSIGGRLGGVRRREELVVVENGGEFGWSGCE